MFTKPTNTQKDYPVQFGRLVDVVEGPAYRNFIRNGDFLIAQRATSFAGIASDQYTIDGWMAGAAGTSTVTQQPHTVGQTDVPGNPKFFGRVQRTVAAAADNAVLHQRIENPDYLSGRTVTASFYARVSSGTKALVFDFSSGGGVTPAVDTSDNAFTATTSWALVKATIAVPAMTAAPSGAYLDFRIREAASFGTFTLDMSDVQIEIGNEATAFERLNFGAALRQQQRFFWKSFQYSTAVAQNSGSSAGAIAYICPTGGASTIFAGVPVRFAVQMRATPTVTFYNPSAANAKWRNFNLAADSSTSAAVANVASQDGFLAQNQQVAGDLTNHTIIVHATATAEL